MPVWWRHYPAIYSHENSDVYDIHNGCMLCIWGNFRGFVLYIIRKAYRVCLGMASFGAVRIPFLRWIVLMYINTCYYILPPMTFSILKHSVYINLIAIFRRSFCRISGVYRCWDSLMGFPAICLADCRPPKIKNEICLHKVWVNWRNFRNVLLKDCPKSSYQTIMAVSPPRDYKWYKLAYKRHITIIPIVRRHCV